MAFNGGMFMPKINFKKEMAISQLKEAQEKTRAEANGYLWEYEFTPGDYVEDLELIRFSIKDASDSLRKMLDSEIESVENNKTSSPLNEAGEEGILIKEFKKELRNATDGLAKVELYKTKIETNKFTDTDKSNLTSDATIIRLNAEASAISFNRYLDNNPKVKQGLNATSKPICVKSYNDLIEVERQYFKELRSVGIVVANVEDAYGNKINNID
jgi:hypothetical protein